MLSGLRTLRPCSDPGPECHCGFQAFPVFSQALESHVAPVCVGLIRAYGQIITCADETILARLMDILALALVLPAQTDAPLVSFGAVCRNLGVPGIVVEREEEAEHWLLLQKEHLDSMLA